MSKLIKILKICTEVIVPNFFHPDRGEMFITETIEVSKEEFEQLVYES